MAELFFSWAGTSVRGVPRGALVLMREVFRKNHRMESAPPMATPPQPPHYGKPCMCGFIISLTKIAHQMWPDYRFSQRNKTIERAMEVRVGGDREGGEVGQNLKKGDRQYMGVFIK